MNPGDPMRVIDDTIRYYAARAKEYDRTAGYEDIVSETIRYKMKVSFRRVLKGRRILEIACGTGYWTRVIATTARKVLATDINEGMLELAKHRLSGFRNVQFRKADAYTLEGVKGPFDSAFSHWWWSHVPRAMLRPFLENLHKRLEPGSFVLFTDHLTSHEPKRRRNSRGDIFEERKLENGKRYRIIKNCPSDEEVHNVLKGIARNIRFKEHIEGYWTLDYITDQL